MSLLETASIFTAVTTMLTSCFFGKSKSIDPQQIKDTSLSVYSIPLKSLDGKSNLDLSQYKGKKILVVNTASECGFTPQYKELQALQDKYKEKLVIIGTPCNQFGGQEPGSSEEIASFCEKNFGVTFPLSEKLEVKGSNQHPLYQWLTQKAKNGALDASVSWNFNKFLINETGQLVGYYPSTVKPLSDELTKAIEK